MIKVSIIVPVYNTGKYIKKCIESLLNQSEENIELIIINDGTKDNSEEIIKNYTDSRIKYIAKENEGIGKTRNLGIDLSKGKYVMFVDSDDYIKRDCVKKMYDRAELDNLDIVVSDYYEDRDGKIKEIKFPSFQNSSIESNSKIINSINLGPCNKIYSRNMLKNNKIRFEEKLKYEDAPFVVKAILSANKIGKINECLSYYVIHKHSETTVRDERIFDIIEISKIIIKEMAKYDNLKDELTNLIVMILADYTIQQRYIKDKFQRDKFIDRAFDLLNNLDKNWRKCSYLKIFPLRKRIIKQYKVLAKIYCDWYNINLKSSEEKEI